MRTERLDLAGRTVLLLALGALLATLGLLIADATAAVHVLNLRHFSRMIPRGPIPFMQTLHALGTSGGGFLSASSPTTPGWIITLLVVGFGAAWVGSAVLLLRSGLRQH